MPKYNYSLSDLFVFSKLCGHGYYGVPNAVIQSLDDGMCAITKVGCEDCGLYAVVAINSTPLVKPLFVGDYDGLDSIASQFDLPVTSVTIIADDEELVYRYYVCPFSALKDSIKPLMQRLGIPAARLSSLPPGWSQTNGDTIRH